MPKGDLSRPERSGDLSPAQQKVKSWLSEMEIECSVERDSFDVTDIWAKMLNATSFEDAVEAQESGIPSGKNLVDVPLSVTEFKVAKSDAKFTSQHENSLPFYMVVEAVNLDTGEPVTFSVGAPNVMILLWQARYFSHLPGYFIIRAKETPNGEMLLLKSFKAAAVKG